MKRIIIGLVILVLVLLWMFRYSVVPGNHGTYRLDRLTGKVTVITTSDIRGPVVELDVIRVHKQTP